MTSSPLTIFNRVVDCIFVFARAAGELAAFSFFMRFANSNRVNMDY